MNITSYLKRIFLISVLAVVLIVFSFLVIIYVQNSRKIHIAFYNIPESVQQTLEMQIDSYFINNQNKRSPSYLTINSNESLATSEIKKASIIICYTGKNLANSQKQELPLSLFSNIPRTLRSASIKDGKAYFLPLLIDHFELAVNTKKYSKMEESTSLSDFLNKAEQISKETNKPSLYCAGASDSQLLQFVGALQEAITGKVPLDSSLNSVSEAISLLQELRFKGVVPNEWVNLSNKDIAYFMQQEKIPFALLPLSEHRNLSYNVSKNYKTFFIPANNNVKIRTFTAPTISAFIPTHADKKNTVLANALLAYLISRPEQAILSTKTGLAPADATANTPDIEADNVRYWIAASSSPYPGLDKTTCTNTEERNINAKLLRQHLNN
ncbi:MAG: hypothetical protein BKP49_06840 [Treponema sp. CETP13]|nr:MAG: hypothetical protein BKP49_06840 [Treponema sp. CETP13]